MPTTKSSPAVKKKPGRRLASSSSMRIDPLRRVDLVQEAVARLEKQILSGKFAPGESIPPEGQLSTQLGVSRTVIREAMRILGAKGLVEVSQGRLPRVKPAGPEHVISSLSTFLQRHDHSLLDLTEARRLLEVGCVALAAQRATPDQVDALEKVSLQLSEADSLDRQIEADLQFHVQLAECSGNPVLGLLLAPLSQLMRISHKETLSRTGAERAAVGHRRIVEAIRHQDVESARHAMLEHLAMAEIDLSGKKAARKGRNTEQ